MKRVLAFASALALAVGAIAPAAFASDLPSVPVPEDNLSIWDTGSTDLDNPYNSNDLFDYCQDFWGDLFDDGRFNNVTVEDNQRYLVELAVSKYVSTHADEEINGVMTSYFDNIVDYVMANPSDFDLYWTPDGVVSALTGNPYMNLQFGEDFYVNLYDYVVSNFYTVPVGDISINGHKWLLCPATVYLRGDYGNYNYSCGGGNGNIYYTTYGYSSVNFARGVVYCSVDPYTSAQTGGISINRRYSGTLKSGYYYNAQNANSDYGVVSCTGFTSMEYSSLNDALTDFFGYPVVENTGDPVSNGKVYIREEPIGGNSLTVSFPALPVSNSKAVSNYYYETYGDTFEDSTTNIDNRVYNNNLTTVYPVTYENNIPLWLVAPTTDITTYNYSLELPSVDLQELPTEFEGGGDFFQDSFLALGGFGSFVLIALSFGLVGLFFKG